MFSADICDQIGYYVYRLIDPRNGETFYVGKGKANRVFDHAKGKINCNQAEAASSKLIRIRAIQNSGFEVQHVIHRHRLDSKTAEEVEGALIDAYQGLTNAVLGKQSGSIGVMHGREIVDMYEAKIFSVEHNLVMITVNRSAVTDSIYEAVRYAWKADIKKVRKADFVLAVIQGLVVGVFIADEWMSATEQNFEGRPDRSPRIGFQGREAPVEIQSLYYRKRVPEKYRRRGAANPIKYAFVI